MRNKWPLKLINNYQKKISPNTEPKCRHRPTCSEYAKQAYERYNFFYASFLTTKRLLKCNRLFKPAYDPVPIRRSPIVKDFRKIARENKNKTIAIDATCGNGHDTIFLSSLYEKVYSFDIQDLAIKRTTSKLYNTKNVELYKEDFNNINKYVEKADLIVFNLGFLPGSNKIIKTQDFNSNLAIRKAYDLLNENGTLVICAYRGHEGGMDEYAKIINEIKDLNFTLKEKYHNNEALITINRN